MVSTKFIFEKKAYHEDSTDEEIEAIKKRVFLYAPQIIYLDEIPVASPYSIGLVFDQIDIISRQQIEPHGLLIDLRNTKRPDAPTRRLVNQRFSLLCENISHVSFCTGKNFLINTTAKFVMYQTDLNSFSINRNITAAAEAIKNKIKNDQ